MKSSTTRPFLKVKEVCARLALSRTKVDALFRAGKLTPHRLGSRSIRVDPDELDRYIEASRQTKPTVQQSVERVVDADSHFDTSDNPFL